MGDGLRALLARALRRALHWLEPEATGDATAPEPDLDADSSLLRLARRAQNVVAPPIPGDRSLPVRRLGPYEEVLSIPDILTYIDKASFDRLAERVRRERGEVESEKKDEL